MIIILWGKHHFKYWFLIGNLLQICMQKLLRTSRSRYAAHEKRGRNDSNVQITEGKGQWMKAVTVWQLLSLLCEMTGWSQSGLWETGILPTEFQTVWAQRPNPERTQGTPLCLKMVLANPGWDSWKQETTEDMPNCCLLSSITATTEHCTAIAVSVAPWVCFSEQHDLQLSVFGLQPKSCCPGQRLGPKLSCCHLCVPSALRWFGIKLIPSVHSILYYIKIPRGSRPCPTTHSKVSIKLLGSGHILEA